ncbi:hypothetical protein [Rhabdaerophilum sp.]|uniref:hypothetical protein n=1 Tax=Rhabdaerophilum sp. TaxID=2717341 RepID=UPI0038D4471B
MTYRLLDKFQSLFVDGPYKHRVSTNGDAVAVCFYEDLYTLARSKALVSRVGSGLSVLNAQNKRQGIVARRGDGSFGEIVPNVKALPEKGFQVLRGPIATIEVGIEVKILAKAMIKQIDRVISDLTGQVTHFKSRGGKPITIGIVGINYAPQYLSFEGEREFPTDGKKYKHPAQEAADAERRLLQRAAPAFDEFVVLRFMASNQANPAYDFAWLNPAQTANDYGAVLARVSQAYEAQHR